jgi:hypothetical protein
MCSSSLSALPSEILSVDYERWRQCGFKRMLTTPVVLCHYPFLLDASAKRRLLAYEAAVQMQSEATQAIMRSVFMGDGASTVLELNVRWIVPLATEACTNCLPFTLVSYDFFTAQVRRSFLLHDTLTQISAHPPADLKKKLRVTFVGEDALDAGGVTKELFQLLVKQLLDPMYGTWMR